MAYLDALKPRLAYDRWDYVRALRAMLPRGIPWNIPLPNESDIRPDSISSSESFGRVTISSGQTFITPDGIVSAESFGLAIVVSEWILQMSGIPSGEAFGAPTVSFPAQSMTVNGIASAEGFGTPTIGFGFMQCCDFESNLCSGWDSAFTTNWYQTTESGEGIAQRASDGTDRLYPPSGQMLSGDFIIEWGFWRSSSEVGNGSIHVLGLNITPTQIFDGTYNYGAILGINGGQFSAPTGPAEQRMKIVRTSGTIWCYRWTGSAWQREDSWTTPGSSVSNSDNLYLSANGGDGVNGFSYICIDGTLV